MEILFLRRQLAILQRAQVRSPRRTRCEKLGLAVLASKLSRLLTGARVRLRESLVLCKPETVLGRHPALVRRKWTFRHRRKPGRPKIGEMIVRLAVENPRWGYARIQGELQKLGFRVACSTISAMLRRHRIPSAPMRGRGGSWCTFLRHYRQQMLACDFFTIDSLFLVPIYVLFFIELGARRIHLAGCTRHPTGAWVAQ